MYYDPPENPIELFLISCFCNRIYGSICDNVILTQIYEAENILLDYLFLTTNLRLVNVKAGKKVYIDNFKFLVICQMSISGYL